MFRPTSDLTSEPGIKYLEYMGMRILRMMMMMRGMLIFMGGIMITAAIVTAVLDLMEYFPAFYYIIGGFGGVLVLIAVLQIVFGVNRWYFNKVRDLRDTGDLKELKRLVYGYGAKSTLAMYALVDLGEIDPYMMQRYPQGSYGKQQMFNE
ncbi:MAG: hypothetical protein ACTSO7_08995 [Candidatus Heimdallarchaeota archaeon]